MPFLTYLRLSLMMLLQYAVWGAWLPVAGKFFSAPVDQGGLGFSGDQVGLLLGLGASIGAVFAPFIAGQFADRYFSTERCLAVMLALGGVLKLVMVGQTDFHVWLWLSIAYSLLYVPTLALSNSLAFAHLTNRDRQFPRVRVWGTLGWIAASWAFPMIWLQTHLHWQAMPPFLVGEERPNATALLIQSLRFSAIISFVYAFLCLFLPHTPPRRDAVEPLAFARAFRLLADPSFLVLVLICLPISMIHNIYFIQTGPFLTSPAVGLHNSDIGPVMTVGQFSELAVLPFLGLLLKRFGFRTVIFIGALAYFVRFTLFGTPGVPTEAIVASQALHGLCYSCFFAAAFIYVDRVAPPDVRHSAQTLIGILLLGLGPILGGTLHGRLTHLYSHAGALDYRAYWYTLAAIGLASAVLFMLLFRERAEKQEIAAGAGAVAMAEETI